MVDPALKNKLREYLNEKEIGVLEKVHKRREFEDYFLSTKEHVKWFYPLKILGYFSPENAPGPLQAEEEGYYTIPRWNVLPYLEKVAQQLTMPEKEMYVNELIEIIRNISQYHIENNKKLDNYITWWYFVKILLNIPNEKIPLDILQLIPVWIDSKFDSSIPGSDIAIKLLPKFLNSEEFEDWKKAEEIVKGITNIKWISLPEERRELLGRKREAKIILDTHWLMESSNINAVKIGERCGLQLVRNLSQKIKQILKRDKSKIYNEADEPQYLFTLRESKDNQYEIRILSISGKKPKDLYEEIFLEREIKGELLKLIKIEGYVNKQEFVNNIKELLLKEETFRKINERLLTRKIQNLYRNLYDNGTYGSLYEESIHPINDALEILTYILKNILLAKAKAKEEETYEILNEFWRDRYLFFKKLVIFIIGKEWLKYNSLFWQILDEVSDDELLDCYYCEPELYKLFRNNILYFHRSQKEIIKDAIGKGPKHYLPEEDQEKSIASWKQKWYSALRSDPDFAKLYEEMRKITLEDVKEKSYKTEFRIGPDPSPLSKEDILKMSNEELAEYLNTFKTKDFWGGPTVGGLADVLKISAQEKPDKFTENLTLFTNLGYFYLYKILWGLKDAWDEKKALDWQNLFEFIKKYINRDDFWHDKFKMIDDDHWNADHLWITGIIGELIQTGTKSDEWAFSEEYIDLAAEIIFIILENQKIYEEKKENNVTHALNSSLGKVITALILLALRIARIENGKGIKKEIKWSSEIKARYEKALRDAIIESYTLLGQYMRILFYLDKNWVKQKVNSILPMENKALWEAFIEGYLWSGHVDDNLYELMKRHYLAAIDYSFKEKLTGDRLVQHICIGYLRGKEIIDDSESLFMKLLDRYDPSQIEDIINFFWLQCEYIEKNIKAIGAKEIEDMKIKILEFWRWIYENKYKQPRDFRDEDKNILSGLAKLTILLPNIDSESFNWILASAPYIHINFNSPLFIKYINNLKDKDQQSSQYVGEIFLKVLATYTPDYDKKHIYSIVEHLYIVGCKDIANEICNIYVRRGFLFLRELYNRNN